LNNSLNTAFPITYGQTHHAFICPAGDEDWFRFSGHNGDRIVVDIDAQANGSALDSYAYLRDSNGQEVTSNDDEVAGRLDSHLAADLPQDGVYFIQIREYNHPNEGGTSYFYSVRLLTDAAAPTAEIISPSNDAYLQPDRNTIRVEAIDSDSGISRVEFLWHDGNWGGSDWVWLGADWDGNNDWNFDWDTSNVPDQTGIAVYVWAFDWAGNSTGAGVWGLRMNRALRPQVYLPSIWNREH